MKSFGKHSNCPTSDKVLSYVAGGLRPLARKRIAQHCALCDFCGAEAQLLRTFTPVKEKRKPAPRPALITVLGVSMPLRKTAIIERLRAA
jgi:hypothetical protein